MRHLLFQLVIVLLVSSCQGQDKDQTKKESNDVHKVIVQEVIHTTSYTYLRALEGEEEDWLAVPKMADVKLGGTYYYHSPMLMKDFASKELGRTFEIVYFLGKVGTTPEDAKSMNSQNQMPNDDMHSNLNQSKNTNQTTGANTEVNKSDVKIGKAEGGISIAELFAKKNNYAGKKVIVKGKVTKYNAAIMNKNWVHLQDGTEHNGLFDLVVTSTQEFKVGDVVIVEGKIVLNKDFGYGYKYDILMEEAVLK